MKIKYLALSLFILAVAGCKKSPGPSRPPEDPNVLTITNGSTCKFQNISGRTDVGLGFPRDGLRQKTMGIVRTAVIFVDFSDAPARRTPQSVFGIASPGAETFLSTASHSKLILEFEPNFKWYRMSKPSTGYNWSNLDFNLHKTYIQEAVNLADADIDFSHTDQVLVMANPDASAISRTAAFIGVLNNAISADGKILYNAMTSGQDIFAFGSNWFPHEFGHSMGAPDLYAYTGPTNGFMGDFDIMANVNGSAPMYNAWQQWLFGWFTDNQVTCVRGKGTGTIQLTPVEEENGMKMLVLPVGVASAVIVEDRRRKFLDNGLQKEGPLVYLIDNSIQSGQGVLRVLPENLNDLYKTNAPLSIGQSLTYGSITVKCTASASGGSTIEYTRR